MKPQLEIDGERVQYDGYYEDDPLGGIPIGSIFGMNEETKPGDEVRGFVPTMSIYFVNVYRVNGDGSIWGIHAAFRKGEWTIDERGRAMLRVWERIV